MVARFISIFLCLGLLLLFASCAKQAIIVNAVNEREANEIVVFLAGQGIDAVKVAVEAGGGGGGGGPAMWNISVDETQKYQAMAILNRAGLPRRPSNNLLKIFETTGLVPSEMQENIKYQAGLAAQIASVIQKFDGILDADVLLSIPAENPLDPSAEKGRVSASVYVKHSGVLDDPNSHLNTKIRRLVANAIPGLKYEDVTVIPERAQYSDVVLQSKATQEEETKLISIWSVVLAKDSATRFRIIFSSFFFAVLILLLAALFLIWKLAGIAPKTGGWGTVFSFRSLKLPEAEKPSGKSEEEGDKENADKAKAQETEPPQKK